MVLRILGLSFLEDWQENQPLFATSHSINKANVNFSMSPFWTSISRDNLQTLFGLRTRGCCDHNWWVYPLSKTVTFLWISWWMPSSILWMVTIKFLSIIRMVRYVSMFLRSSSFTQWISLCRLGGGPFWVFYLKRLLW